MYLPKLGNPMIAYRCFSSPAIVVQWQDWLQCTQAYGPTAFLPDLNTTPSGDVEVELMNIFSKVLKVDNGVFSVSRILFTIGLNSLMAVQAASIVSNF